MTSAQGGEYDGKLIARTVLLVLGAVGAAILLVVVIVISVFATSDGPGWAGELVTGGCFVLIFTPPILFGVLSFESSGDRQYSRRWILGSALLQLLAIVGVIVGGIVSSPPLWFPILVIALGVAFELIGILLGRLLRTTAVSLWPSVLTEWTPLPQRNNRVFVCLVATVGVGVFGVAVLDVPPWNWASPVRVFISACLIFGCAIGVLVCAIRMIPVANKLRNSLGGNYANRRFIAGAVVGSKRVELDALQLELARRYAAVMVAFQPWQLATFGFLIVEFLGLFVEFQSLFAIVPRLGLPIPFGHDSPGAGFAVVAVLGGIVCLVTLAVQYVRVRRFLALNGQPTNALLPAA
jgi:MFS family permease